MDAKEIIQTVESIVTPAYLVGGSVRDLLLDHEPKDYDFCTPVSPDDIEAAVKAAGRRAYSIGKRFGTIGFKLNNNYIEITTFRQESYATGNRKPQVTFVNDLTYDLARRDFTINAIAMSVADNKVTLTDPFGGQNDIQQKIIRSVGNPLERIKEDPLRMLRAARFASQLGFQIEPLLLKKIAANADLIYTVSKERWVAELDLLLLGQHPKKGLEYLASTGLLKCILPELAIQIGFNQGSPYHTLDLWEHTITAVSLTPPDVELRWAALLHDIGKPAAQAKNAKGYSNYMMHEKIGAEITEGIAYRLRWSNARREKVVGLVRNHLENDSALRGADNGAK